MARPPATARTSATERALTKEYTAAAAREREASDSRGSSKNSRDVFNSKDTSKQGYKQSRDARTSCNRVSSVY